MLEARVYLARARVDASTLLPGHINVDEQVLLEYAGKGLTDSVGVKCSREITEPRTQLSPEIRTTSDRHARGRGVLHRFPWMCAAYISKRHTVGHGERRILWASIAASECVLTQESIFSQSGTWSSFSISRIVFPSLTRIREMTKRTLQAPAGP